MMNTIPIPNYDAFSFYRRILEHPILKDYVALTTAYRNAPNLNGFAEDNRETYFALKRKILDYALNKDSHHQYAQTPWQDFLITMMISSENALTLLFERGEVSHQHPSYKNMMGDIRFSDLYAFNWAFFLEETQLDTSNIFESAIFFPLPPHDALDNVLRSGDDQKIFNAANRYILTYGRCIYENYHYFKLEPDGRLSPIPLSDLSLSERLVGCEKQKKVLLKNLSDFINEGIAKHTLLYGEAGNGKTSMVRSLIQSYKTTRLRIIELHPNQHFDIPGLLADISQKPYAYLLFMDGFTYDNEDEMLFNNIPKNVLIFATSDQRLTSSPSASLKNTRELHHYKATLQDYFDEMVLFPSPTQNEYLAIVNTLAMDAGIDIPITRLENKAIQWELKNLNRTGLTAKTFVDSLVETTTP